MWDLIVSVPDHCLYFYYDHCLYFYYERNSITLKRFIHTNSKTCLYIFISFQYRKAVKNYAKKYSK